MMGEPRNESAKFSDFQGNAEVNLTRNELDQEVMYEIHARNLAQLYLDLEEAVVPTDILNIRPRELPKGIQTAFLQLLKSMDKHFLLEKHSFRNRVRGYVRLWCQKSGGFIGWVD
tara:strand:- start:2167 stop:2511 length:345 start_codon:yes stop_codon:yes gene_type:complete